jgi:ribokinase
LNAAPPRKADPDLLRAVDGLVVNELEAVELLGTEVHDVDSALGAAAPAAAAGIRTAIITLGAAGAVVCQGGSAFHVQPFQVQAVDTTAAGDAFVGALATALVEGEGLEQAARLGAAAGAAAATKAGAQTSLPRRQDLRELFGLDWHDIGPSRPPPTPSTRCGTGGR